MIERRLAVKSGFCHTGTSPFEENIFEEHEFFESAVTDRPKIPEDQAEDITVAAEEEINAMHDDALAAPINSRLKVVVRSPTPFGLGRNGC